ncbi:MAG: hypothetical protein JSU83_15385 [Deltaproteobacteria bacterium]|nr:MAG: hypothetical protein JSU83_15385 [Deltaproteobacteria bacterium]
MKPSTGQLADEIKQIYSADPSQAGTLIERYLEQRLNKVSGLEKLMLLKTLADQFNRSGSHSFDHGIIDKELLSRIFSLMLGREVTQDELSSPEFMQKLAESLNTIFDTLNQLVGIINATLLGEDTQQQTIRHLIGSQLEKGGESESLEIYLSQIRKAFLIAQKAYRKAALSVVSRILGELNPAQISKTDGKGLKFGPFRKAEYYEIFEGKFHTCQKWFKSGRFMQEFQREFEKNCQKLSRQ